MIIVRSVLSFTGTPNNGSLPIGNGQGFTINTLTAGTNITITNGPGTITIDAAGGGGSPAGNTNEIQFNNAGAFAADSDLRWIISDDRLVLGTENTADTNSRMVIIGKGISTNNTFVVHNSTGTNNALVVRDDGRVGILTNNPTTPLTIGSSILARTNLNNTGGSVLYSRQDGNHSIRVTLDNEATTGANTSALLGGRAGDMQIAIGCTNESYTGAGTNQYLGNQGRSGVIIAKASSNNVAKLKLILTNTTNAAINRFEWISGTAISGTFTNGTTATPIMTLIGNGNLLIGTTTDVASSILTLESTTKGFLPPRNADPATNIATPAEGLIAFDTTDKKLQVFDGTNWIDLH